MTHKEKFIQSALDALRPHLESLYDQAYEQAYDAASESIRSNLNAVLSGALPKPTFQTSASEAYEPAQTSAKKQETVREAVLRVVGETPGGVLPKDIVASTHINNNSVRGMLWTLNKEGKLSKNDQDKWVLKGSLFD